MRPAFHEAPNNPDAPVPASAPEHETEHRRRGAGDPQRWAQRMRAVSIVPFAILAMLIVGCTHTDQSVSENVSIDPMTVPSFRQQAEADTLIEFLDWDSMRVIKPVTASGRTIDKSSFLEVFAKPELPKAFAVVVMDKRWSIAGERVSLDEIERVLRQVGFHRVVFQQARSAIDMEVGLPVLRDTAQRP